MYVLSETVSKALKLTGGSEVAEMVEFTEYMDKFFKAVDVCNYVNGVHWRMPFQLQYILAKDQHLEV